MLARVVDELPALSVAKNTYTERAAELLIRRGLWRVPGLPPHYLLRPEHIEPLIAALLTDGRAVMWISCSGQSGGAE